MTEAIRTDTFLPFPPEKVWNALTDPRELGIRAVIVVIVILLVRSGGAFRDHSLNTDAWRAGIGLVLFALGLGFAIRARVASGATGAPR